MQYATLRTWEDLQRYGINALTREACAYSMRILCDVNDEGARLIRAYFGLPADGDRLAPSWNSQVNGRPAVGSVMLTTEELKPLCRFILFHVERFPFILCYPDSYTGITELPEDHGALLVLRNPAGPESVNGRNVHQMTGRLE